jgi:Phage Tail Collar Domain
MSDYFAGEIPRFRSTFLRRSWAMCQGTRCRFGKMPRYTLLGVRYGGNGTTTLQPPDLQGACPDLAKTGGLGQFVFDSPLSRPTRKARHAGDGTIPGADRSPKDGTGGFLYQSVFT